MEPKSLVDAPPDSGKGGVGPKNSRNVACPAAEVEEKNPAREGSPSIKLGLGIGDGSGGGGPSHVTRLGKSVFSPAQLHELQQQSLILKYMVAGLAVPFDLILPIWKSVARSFGSSNGGIFNKYPSFIGFSPQGFDYRSMIDPEPGRCRRTDGKKWRCSREVVPDQKYCERHMHRGRQRSRKHVEASLVTSESVATLDSNNTQATINSSHKTGTESDPINLQLATPSLNTSSNSPASTASAATCITGVNGSDYKIAAKVYGNENTTTTVGLTSAAAGNTSNIRSNINSVNSKHAGYSHFNNWIDIKGSGSNVNQYKAGSFVAPGFSFSPTSVLQSGVGSSSSCVGYRNALEAELQRCRRTDGKKWRCSREVIADQKYCGRHVHRGAKKHSPVASQSVMVAAAAPPSSRFAPPLAVPQKTGDPINLDTTLSISIAACPPQVNNREGSPAHSCNSSSDATTITDENGSVSHLLALSP